MRALKQEPTITPSLPNLRLMEGRAEAFPFGLRVLVVDDDPTWLKILEKMLRKCSYEVTTCSLARIALEKLRERKDKFDIVISDVNMPDMDGFKLLEHVGLEMDLPVIMMSVDGETSRVMNGVQHGACDYLHKPIRMKELRNIWQHVYRKKIHEVKEIESQDINEDIHIIRNGSGDFDSQLLNGVDLNSLRKRKDVDSKEHDDQDFNDSAALKKARVVWSVDLHQKFVNAVNQIGLDKVGPKKILDLMNVPGITRENVASHLQKYRLYLSRLHKQNEGRLFGGNIEPYVCSKDFPRNFTHQNHIALQRNTAASRYVCTTEKIHEQSILTDSQVDDIKSVVSLQMTDRKEAITIDAPDSQTFNSVSQLGVVLSFKGTATNAGYKSCQPALAKNQQRSGSIPVTQFMQYPKHDHEPYGLLGDYSLPEPSQQYLAAVDLLHTPPSVISITRNTEKDKIGLSQIKPIFMDCRSSHIKTISPVACKIDTVSVQVEHGVVNPKDLGAAHEINSSPGIKDNYFDQTRIHNVRPPSRESSLKDGEELTSLPEDLSLCALQGIACFDNVGLNSMEFFQYNDSASMEIHSNWYDGLEVNCEYFYDSVIDECFFA